MFLHGFVQTELRTREMGDGSRLEDWAAYYTRQRLVGDDGPQNYSLLRRRHEAMSDVNSGLDFRFDLMMTCVELIWLSRLFEH